MIEKIEHYTKENLIGQKRTFFARENRIKDSYPLHFHDYYELEIILEGAGIMTLNGKEIPFSKNTVSLGEVTGRISRIISILRKDSLSVIIENLQVYIL